VEDFDYFFQSQIFPGDSKNDQRFYDLDMFSKLEINYSSLPYPLEEAEFNPFSFQQDGD
jgi:hypothetical protein